MTLPFVAGIATAGALVTRTGHYVPFIILGQSICAISTGFLTRINTATPIVGWAAPLTLAGLGLGMAMQLPYMAVQTALSDDDVIAGNALVTLFAQVGGALGLSISSTLFLNRLFAFLAANPLTTSIRATAVVAAGAADLPRLTAGRSDVLKALQKAYANSVDDALVFSVVASCVSILAAACMERLNIKAVALQREERLLRDNAAESPARKSSDGLPLSGVASKSQITDDVEEKLGAQTNHQALGEGHTKA